MVILRCSNIIICLIVIDVALSNLPTGTTEVDNLLDDKIKNDSIILNSKKIKTRRKNKKKQRSTSSSSDEKGKKSKSGTGESLSLSYDESLSTSTSTEVKKDKKKVKKKYEPVSSIERRGWRKWHRKCARCPEMTLKWRSPQIKWICGAYQRARRSFKSLCMMHYRNCQDGTMFTKIADHRCKNDTENSTQPRGEHFFYDYHAQLTDDDSSSTSGTSSETEDSSSSSF